MDKALPIDSTEYALEEIADKGDVSQETVKELLKKPHIFVALVQNAFTVAQSLRDNYFADTARLVSRLRTQLVDNADEKGSKRPIFKITQVDMNKNWESYRGEEIAFIDGGFGSVDILGQVPMLLRVGTYKVKTGETVLSQREKFSFYPMILGDLIGGSKERRDYTDIVRIIAELLAVLRTLQHNPNLDILVLHGPLVYMMGQYAGHIPFTEEDMDKFLLNYAVDEQDLKKEFQEEASHIYPQMSGQWRSTTWVGRLEGRYETITLIRFLLCKIVKVISDENRPKKPLICGVTERATLSEFTEKYIFQRAFDKNPDCFNNIFGRNDINSAEAAVKRLGYNDPLILSMLLRPGEYSEPFNIEKYEGFYRAKGGGDTAIPEIDNVMIDYKIFRPHAKYSFPEIKGFYLQISENTFPIRIEVFGHASDNEIREVAQRVYLYSSLLPGYAFPIGLDIADKYVKVPNWLSDAYEKLIKYHIMDQLYQGQITDKELRKIIIKALCTTQRDWLFRPPAK